MHILTGLLTLAGIAALIVYRMYMISQSQAGQDLANAAGGIQKYLRRRAWNKKLGDPLRDVDDARVAAAAMMVALAQADGPLSERAEKLIKTQMKVRFDIDDTLTSELFAHARWLVRDISEPENCFIKVRPTVLKACGPQERAELLEMMSAVADAGADVETQRTTVARLAQTLRA